MNVVSSDELRVESHAVTAIEKKYMRRKPGTTYIANDDLDHSFSQSEVDYFKQEWQVGRPLVDIAQDMKRDPDEVFLLLVDWARKTRKKFKVDHRQIWQEVLREEQ